MKWRVGEARVDVFADGVSTQVAQKSIEESRGASTHGLAPLGLSPLAPPAAANHSDESQRGEPLSWRLRAVGAKAEWSQAGGRAWVERR